PREPCREVLDAPAPPVRLRLKENVLHVILVEAERQPAARFVEGAWDPVGAEPVLELVPEPAFQLAVRRPHSGFLPIVAGPRNFWGFAKDENVEGLYLGQGLVGVHHLAEQEAERALLARRTIQEFH